MKIWADYLLLKSWYHRNIISNVVLGHSAVEVLINTRLRYWMLDISLRKKESTLHFVKNILCQVFHSCGNEQTDQIRTAMGTLRESKQSTPAQ